MKPSFCTDNRDLSCFLVTKISWKGKYRRIFSIGTLAITTYHPSTLEITNQWLYEDFLSIKCLSERRYSNADAMLRSEEFQIQVRKKGKVDLMRFSSEFSRDVVTEALRYQPKFGSNSLVERPKYECFKHGWSDQRVPVCFAVTSGSLDQIDVQRKCVLKSYFYKDMKQIVLLKDYPGGFVVEVGEQRRRHFFVSNARDQLIQDIRNLAAEFIAVDVVVAKDLVKFDDFFLTRLGLCSKDEQLTPYVDFKVQKFTDRADSPVRRLICLSEQCFIERDPTTYAVICARPLRTIVCLVRDLGDPQRFIIQYENGDQRTYASNERDSLLASLVDGTRASRNYQVFVTSRPFERSLRLFPFGQLLDEESEAQLMRSLINVPPGLTRADMIRRFNANVPYNGLTFSNASEGILPGGKGRMITSCLEAVLAEAVTTDSASALRAHANADLNSPFVTAGAPPRGSSALKRDDNSPETIWQIEAQLACLHRLFASKSGFQAFTTVNGIREALGTLVVTVLKRGSEAVDNAVVETLCALMQPMHANYELRLEQLNKKSLLTSRLFIEHLLELIVHHVNRGTGALVIASMLDFLTYSVCAPYSETTPGEIFDMILELVAVRGRSFYRLFHSPSMTIVKGAGLVMKAIIEESPKEISKRMQNLSLTEGAFLKHLELALFSPGRDLRVVANRQLSGQLISLWIAENSAAMELLRRCIPRGLLDYLESSEKAPVSEQDLIITRNNLQAASNEARPQSQLQEQLRTMQITVEARIETLLQHWNLNQKIASFQTREDRSQKTVVVLRKRRRQVKASANWKMFCYQFGLDHAKADLIWNEKTKSELRQAIEKEMAQLRNEMDSLQPGTFLSWNHTEFEVAYSSLQEEIRIGDYYLRFLLNENNEDATPIHNPSEFFNNIYHRFLLASRSDYKCICLKAMGIVYERHCITIGSFSDSKEIVEMMLKCVNAAERDHYLFLIHKLVLDKNNVRDLITAGVVPHLVDLASLAHLHVNRAKIHSQTNVIENGPGADENQSKEWYYKDKNEQRQGPLSFQKMKELYQDGTIFEKTSVWAEGLMDWCHLSAVPQFRWTVVCTRSGGLSTTDTLDVGGGGVGALYNFTELCSIVLDTLIQMCAFFPSRDEANSVIRPLPRVKKILSQPILLYPIVQLLLTYDPSIVCRVAQLLNDVMQDNPMVAGLYLSGIFFFILMYNGSNILPIARFLHQTHLRQAFRSTLSKSEMASRSVLCPLLPEATIYYLEQYGPEKYAEVFLGEFENPEIIWNTEMRRHMIEKIALHVSDFTSRLSSNVKVLYNYCPIPPIEYPQLKDELFCHFYYLRHLTDETKFPDWPIREPVQFLRACLHTWQEEINKKPASMSVEQACERLGLSTTDESWKDQSAVRRAYFKLAPKYHPDRNPDGREQFEQINSAYEFLTSTLVRSKNSSIPDLQRVVVCLRAQSIVYSRHLKVLSPYKYAGYTQLIKTIELESADDALFSATKPDGGLLLMAAVELCYWTLRSSPLNAEQLRRDCGLDVLYKTFERCSSMVGLGAREDDMAVQVCQHVCNCFATAARFESCRERICEMKDFFSSLCRLLRFEHLTRLACVAAECICSFSVSTLLQTQLFQAGVIWQLVPHLFRFDYTLDEGGVSHSEKFNQQAVLNKLARSACEALSCLAGYRPETPENDGVQNSLRAMLTSFVCCVMAKGWPYVTTASNGNNGTSLAPANAEGDTTNGAVADRTAVTPRGSVVARTADELSRDDVSEASETSNQLDDSAVEADDYHNGYCSDLAARLKRYRARNDQILKVLNANTENPYIVWDNATRAELLDFVERHRTSSENTSDLFGAEFRMSIYAKELVVGDIFVRIYNNMPEFKLYEPKKVSDDLLDYLNENVPQLLGDLAAGVKGVKSKATPATKPMSLADGGGKKTDNLIDFEAPPVAAPPTPDSSNFKLSGNQVELKERVLMVLTALHNVLLRNSGVETSLIGYFEMVFGLLRAYHLPDVQERTLQVIWVSSRNRECISDIACTIRLPLLLVLFVKLPRATEILLKTLLALVSNGAVVKELLEYGGLIYVLSVFVNSDLDGTDDNSRSRSSSCGARMLAAQLLSKLQSDKLTGPKWSRFIIAYLPALFADQLKDDPGIAINLFDTNAENPELIWNAATRANVRKVLAESQAELVREQLADPTRKWNATINTKCAYDFVVSGELIVGGIYLRLFIANPSWNVRHSRQFATELMEQFLELVGRLNKNDSNDDGLVDGRLEQVTKALCLLFMHHQQTADQIPAQGYLPQFCTAMQNAKTADAARSALLMLRQLSENNVKKEEGKNCSLAFGSLPVIRGLFNCMKQQPKLVAQAAHSLKYLLRRCTADLAEQMLLSGLVQHVLKLLADPMPGVEGAAAVKAELVDALKSAAREPEFGSRIAAILQASSVWAQYRDQRHDLFLPATNHVQAITGAPSGSTAGVAGYLTDTMFEPPPQRKAPPPVTQPKPTSQTQQPPALSQPQNKPPPPSVNQTHLY